MRDKAADVWKSARGRPQRTFLTAVGVALGVAGLVAIILLGDSNAVQVAHRFDRYAATEVTLDLPPELHRIDDQVLQRRLQQVHGVLAAGQFDIASGGETAAANVSLAIPGAPSRSVPTIVASHGGVTAKAPVVASGSVPSRWAWDVDTRTVMIGQNLAAEFQVDLDAGSNAVLVNGARFAVAAVLEDRGVGSLVSSSLLLSPPAAASLGIAVNGRTDLVRTARGAGSRVALLAPQAVYPPRPELVSAAVPPDPTTLRGRLTADSRNLLLALSGVTLLVSSVGIANMMVVAVLERRKEIGIRRSLGGSQGGIASLFLFESALIGAAGGLVGFVLGVVVSFAMTAQRGIPFSVPPSALPVLGLGLVVGTVSGVYPAWASTRVEPVEALRA